jgi:hypothetical protein
MLVSAWKFLIVAVVSVVPLVAAASAAASTVTVSPTGAKTATATAGTRIAISGAGGTTTATCTGGTSSGTVFSASGRYPIAVSVNTQPIFTGCRFATLNTDIVCRPTGVLAVTADTDASGVTPVQLTGLNCTISLTGTPTCNVIVTGSVRGQFANTGSQLTILRTGQSLTAAGSTCTSTFQNGAVGFSSAVGFDVAYSVTPTTTINAV